jgi:hypothetical protein
MKVYTETILISSEHKISLNADGPCTQKSGRERVDINIPNKTPDYRIWVETDYYQKNLPYSEGRNITTTNVSTMDICQCNTYQTL